MFEPRARSAWHAHPLGQIQIVTERTGWIQQWEGPIENKSFMLYCRESSFADVERIFNFK